VGVEFCIVSIAHIDVGILQGLLSTISDDLSHYLTDKDFGHMRQALDSLDCVLVHFRTFPEPNNTARVIGIEDEMAQLSQPSTRYRQQGEKEDLRMLTHLWDVQSRIDSWDR